MGNHALVFGASGIQGWAVVNQILEDYPSSDTFERVTALTNRPVSNVELLWPQSDKLQVVSGIDLLTTDGQDALESSMKRDIVGISDVTHVFFFAYILKEKAEEEVTVNCQLLQRAIRACQALSHDLRFVLLPTGTKAYGVHMLDQFPFSNDLPLSESLQRIPEPWRSQNFYYNMCDWLETESKDKSWTWCEIRPDVVVGFVPNNNIYCLAQILALYLSCFKEAEGEGSECAFPGNEISWKNLSNDSSQDIIARFAIHCALNPDTCGQGQAFNVADHSEPRSWSNKWPIVCEYFRLKGVSPPRGGSGPQPLQYLAEHKELWTSMEKKYDLATGRVNNDRTAQFSADFLMTLLDFDRQLDLRKSHRAWNMGGGRSEQTDTRTAWWTAFQRFRTARIIP